MRSSARRFFTNLKNEVPRASGCSQTIPSLFECNPDVDFVLTPWKPRADRILHRGLRITRLTYAGYDPVSDSDAALKEHIIVTLCRQAGINGSIELRPRLFFSAAELAGGKIFDRQVVIQSSGLASLHPMKNKEWVSWSFSMGGRATLKEREISSDSAWPSHPLIEGAHDLRGKTTLRQSAAILANSLVFVGLVGFLMHLARAVDCRAVIVYGGRETPSTTGYIGNTNLTGPTSCSPCWLRNRCDYNLECMNMIPAESALEAARKQIALRGTPPETETAVII